MRYLNAPLLSIAVAIIISMSPSAGATSPDAPGLLPPANMSLPSISGTAQQGQTLSADPGSWSGPAEAEDYQWQRCDSGGSSCGAVGGATGQSYLLGSADVGATMRVAAVQTVSGGDVDANLAQRLSLPEGRSGAVVTAVVTPADTAPGTALRMLSARIFVTPVSLCRSSA